MLSGKRLLSAEARYGFLLLLVAVLCAIPLFRDLGWLTIRMWDESRLAVSVLEMKQQHSYIISLYDGQPDLWSTKPPLMLWLEWLSMDIFGFNEFAFRIPAATTALLTALSLYIFGAKYLRSRLTGVLAAVLLVCVPGYLGEHVARTGDYDSLLVLWVTLYSLCFFMATYGQRLCVSCLYGGAVAIVLAVLTKSIAGLVPLAGIGLYMLLAGRWLLLLRSRHFYLAALLCISGIAAYYVGRELAGPGYLQAVWVNEFSGRFGWVPQGHEEPFWYYWNHLSTQRFAAGLYALPFALVLCFISKRKIIRRLALFGCCYLVCFFFAISFSATRNFWYDAPLYPIAVLLIAAGAVEVIYRLLAWRRLPNGWAQALKPVLVLLILAKPYTLAVQSVKQPFEYPMMEQEYGKFFRAYWAHPITHLKVIRQQYNSALQFYIDLSHIKGWQTLLEDDLTRLQPGDTVVTIIQPAVDELQKKYELHFLDSHSEAKLFVIEGKK